MCLESFCSIKKIRKIEVCDVITNDDIWVDLFHKIPPFLEHLYFTVERDDLGANNVGAGIKREHVPDEGPVLSCITIVGIGWQGIEIESNLAESPYLQFE